jgi:hypothetical protein
MRKARRVCSGSAAMPTSDKLSPFAIATPFLYHLHACLAFASTFVENALLVTSLDPEIGALTKDGGHRNRQLGHRQRTIGD